MTKQQLAGTSTLMRWTWKRDRLRLSLWVLGIALLVAGLTATFANVFTDDKELISMIRMFMANPAMRALLAPAAGVSLGGFVMMRSSTLLAVLIALMSVMTVIRHTRQNEEIGRADLIGSTVVGRQASLTAAVSVTLLSNLTLILLMTASLIWQDLPARDALWAAAALGSVGVVFTGVAAIAAQLAETSRGASAICGLILGATFLLSAVGNMLGQLEDEGTRLVSAWPVWLSPFGWYQQVHAFHGNRAIVLVLPVAFFGLTVTLACILASRRDIGMGIIPARRGLARANPILQSPWGFALRLQRQALLVWAAVMIVTGVIFGAASGEFSHAMADLERADEIFGAIFDMDEVFMMMIIGILGSFTVFYTVQAFNRMAAEEKDGYLEHLMATPLPRLKWLLSHLLFIFVGTGLLLTLIGLAGGMASFGEEQIRLAKVLEAALVQAPAALVLAGFAVAAFGMLPRFGTPLAWLGLGVSLLAGPFLGPALDLPDWLQNLSPFTHVPAPSEPFTARPLIFMGGLGLLLAVIGVVAFCLRSLKRP